MKVTMVLADAAQAVGGKLYILGGGWSRIGPAPQPTAIAIKVDVPWDQANTRHTWALRLHDADGAAVQLPGVDGPQDVELAGNFEVGRPPGLVQGTPLDMVLAITLGPIPLGAGRYLWQLEIDGGTDEDWTLPFTVRSETDTF